MTHIPKYQRYKDSGVEWLGRVPEHWEIKKGRYLFEESNDRSCTGEDTHLSMSQRLGLVPADQLSAKSLQSESYEGGKLCKTGDIVLNRLKAHLGVFAVAKQNGVVSPDYSVFRLRDGQHRPGYFDSLFKTPAYLTAFNKAVRGIVVGFYRLYTGDFFDIPFLVPPSSEQDRIVSFLDQKTADIDTLIAKKERQIELLDEQRNLLINRAITRGLDPSVPLRDSGNKWIGQIPARWHAIRIRHAFRVIDCKHVTVPFTGGGHSLISIGELDTTVVDLTHAKKTSPKYFTLLSEGERRVRVGDIIFSRNASVGKCSLVVQAGAAMGQDVCLLRSDEINPEFAVQFLRSPAFQKQLSEFLLGTTFSRINIAELKELYVVAPEPRDVGSVLVRIREVEFESRKLIKALRSQIQSLQNFRNTLVAHTVTGQIRV